MDLSLLTAVSPIDGRYRNKTKELTQYFSEFALIKYRVYVEIEYFIDWGGSLIWLQVDKISAKILKDIKEVVNKASGYLTVIKIEENLKASIDVFTIDPIKYKISEKIKKSFDPKRILNPGKMYPGI